MLYLFWGDDTQKKSQSYEKFVKSIPIGVEIFFISKNDFDKTQIESLYSGAGLFFNKCVVIARNVFENKDTLDFVLEKLAHISASSNDFIFLERELNKPVIDAFKKAGAELYGFELPKQKKEKFNNFLLANAFGKRDKLNLWIYYRQAVEKGVGLEELVGVLFWKAKDMILKKTFYKFSESELKNFIAKLSYILPEARKQGRDDETVLERFLLDMV